MRMLSCDPDAKEATSNNPCQCTVGKQAASVNIFDWYLLVIKGSGKCAATKYVCKIECGT